MRIIYEEWYRKIIKDLINHPKTLELGAGTGNFKEYKPDVISADIDPQPWLDMCFDAHQIPFQDGEVGNIVLIDVFHHLANPILFLEEAHRVLCKGGRIVMLEPFPSAFSLPIYRKFHPEPFIMNIDYFSKQGLEQKDPWDSNQAIPFLIFFKHYKSFLDKFGEKFKIIKKEKLSFLLYPASGGFENKAMIPDWSIPFFQFIEKILYPLRSLLAFRCYIVLEKK
ncbi:class I SAM-dependent methyltransferase [Raineya sp.]